MNRGAVLRSLIPSLIINGLLPFLIYSALKNYTNLSDFVALIATGIPSTIVSLAGIIRNGRIDFMAGVALFTIAVSLALIALGGSPKLYLIRESFFTAAFGLAYLISMPFPKPLTFYFARYFMAGNNSDRIAFINQLWERSPYFRTAVYRIGLLWSVGLLFEAVVRTYMVFTLSVQQFLAISPFVLYGITGALIALSMLYGQHMRRKGEEAERQQVG